MQNLPWELWLNAAELAHGLRVEVAYDAASRRLGVALHNETSAPVTPGELRLEAELDAPAAGNWMWIQGRYMQTDALVRRFGERALEGYDGRFRRNAGHQVLYTSREQMVLSVLNQPSPVLCIGCLRMDRFFLDIEVALDAEESRLQQLALVFDLEATVLAPGESLELPPVWLAEGHDAERLMEEYAAEAAAEMRARVPDHVPTGWCSWYYFYNRVSEADIRSNLETMVRERHPAEYVQIDDGYQAHTGDWLTPNQKFPSGMKALAAAIREAGYKPGLWLAPFVLNEASAALREHPDMVLKDAAGEVIFVNTWLGRCAVLDCTNPEAEAWLRNVVDTAVREWGYQYLKLDACSYAAQHATRARYHDPARTGPGNLRRGLEIIRAAAGDETFLLGCTCHFGPAIGLVDGMRVGPDVKELWADGPNPSVRHAMRLALQRNWMHRRWWVNDPDCLIARHVDTALDEAETRFLLTGIALSGGMVVASDDLPKLSPERRTMAQALFPPPGAAARPLDPGDAPVPRVWRAALRDGQSLVGILNWDDEAVWVPWGEILQAGEIAFDVWNRRLLPMGDVLLRPHEGALWQVSAPGPTPRVVGDSGSLTGRELFVRQVSGRVQVRNDSDRERTIAIEARGQTFAVVLEPGEMRWFD